MIAVIHKVNIVYNHSYIPYCIKSHSKKTNNSLFFNLYWLDITLFYQFVRICLLFTHWSDYSNYINIT